MDAICEFSFECGVISHEFYILFISGIMVVLDLFTRFNSETLFGISLLHIIEHCSCNSLTPVSQPPLLRVHVNMTARIPKPENLKCWIERNASVLGV
jgi:hypothetical protein